MIVLRITSGLGNQMFQYAFYTLLKEKYSDTEVVCDTTWFNSNFEHRSYELEKIFKNVEGSLFEIKKANLYQIIRLSGKIPNLFNGAFGSVFEKLRRYPNRILKDTVLKKREPFILDQLSGEIIDESVLTADGRVANPFFDRIMNLDTDKDWFISGYFIEERYYSQIIEKVKQRFIFPDLTESHNIQYADEIKGCDSVSIHVRRGDYLSDIYKDSFLTLGRDYYEQAVNCITDIVGEQASKEGRDANIKFFIFSDDEAFIKKEFDWIENKIIVSGNGGDISFRDIQLMSMCRHNIVANSTFSQWGALLNQNEGHITIYPKAYMKDSDNEKKLDPSWIQI